jgi:hypothetical protein
MNHSASAAVDANFERIRFLIISQLHNVAYAQKASAPTIIERASIAAKSLPFVAIVSPRVASATEGAAANKPAKLLGLRMSPRAANNDTMRPPMAKRKMSCVINNFAPKLRATKSAADPALLRFPRQYDLLWRSVRITPGRPCPLLFEFPAFLPVRFRCPLRLSSCPRVWTILRLYLFLPAESG